MRANHYSTKSFVLMVLPVVWMACGTKEPVPTTGSQVAPPMTSPGLEPPPDDIFLDRAAVSGLDFRHINGMSGRLYYPEMMGSGVALFDFDNDGDLDVYLVQGGPLEAASGNSELPSDRLYRNDLEIEPGGARHLHFTDVTESAGLIGATGYGMGAVAFDLDNDGWTDLYLTNLGANQLWRNRGDGTFIDITASSGTGLDSWSVPAAVLDFDADGWLDLFVGNYVEYDLRTDSPCRDELGSANYCGPLSFRAAPDQLLRNQGDGTFLLSTEAAGLSAESGRTLGAVATDFDNDGQWDLYVGNDGTPNRLWINTGQGTFDDRALLAGAAVNRQGLPEASMGIAVGDLEGDGDEDLFITHLAGETHTLYLNDGQGSFFDHTTAAGLGPPSLPSTGFGTGWLDFDNDGLLDLLAVNGAVKVIKSLALDGDPFPLHQPNQLFHNLGDGRFADRSKNAGAAFSLSEVSRGAAFGDMDNDGDTDVVISNNHGPVRLLINQVGQEQPWVGVRLVDGPRRSVPGARAGLFSGDRALAWRRDLPAGSYGSSNDSRLLFAAAGMSQLTEIRVGWPDGSWEKWNLPPLGRYSELHKGSGQPAGFPGTGNRRSGGSK